jgi:hypothetical protein
MDLSQLQEAARQGAFIEFVGGSLAGAEAPARIDRFADAIRRIGPQFCILSYDLDPGKPGAPASAFIVWPYTVDELRAKGFSDADLNYEMAAPDASTV